MPTLETKADALPLIREDVFYEALMIDSNADFEGASEQLQKRFSEHYAHSFHEHGSGITLFSTPNKPIAGGDPWCTWLSVSKDYASKEAVYTLSAHQYAPWGNEVDISVVGEFADLGSAFDMAFAIHEHGSIDLFSPDYDEEADRMVRGPARVVGPHEDSLSYEAKMINAAVERLAVRRLAILEAARLAKAQAAEIHRLTWKTPIPFAQALPIIEDIKARLQQEEHSHDTDSMLALASAINDRVFAGEGKLLRYRCVDHEAMEQYYMSRHGTVFVVVEQRPGEFTYVSGDCGVHTQAGDARAAVIASVQEAYKSFSEGENLYWSPEHGELVELVVDELVVDEPEPAVFDEEEMEYLSYHPEVVRPNDYKMRLLVDEACADYRKMLGIKVKKAVTLEASQPEQTVGSSL